MREGVRAFMQTELNFLTTNLKKNVQRNPAIIITHDLKKKTKWKPQLTDFKGRCFELPKSINIFLQSATFKNGTNSTMGILWWKILTSDHNVKALLCARPKVAIKSFPLNYMISPY